MKRLLLHYYLTNRCNSRCVFCTIWQETPKVDAAEEDVFRNLFYARKAGCSFVDFTGGEPLLHNSLPLFLKEAKRLGFITSITTNCILFASKADELRKLVDLLHFSIDSDDKRRHNDLRGVDCYDHVIKSIALAKELKMAPDLLYTYNNDNIDSVDGIYKIARKNKLILILDPVFDPWAPDKVTWLTHNKAIELSKKSGIYLNRAHILLRSRGGNRVNNPLCKAMDTTFVILPDNKLALPCFHHRSRTIRIEKDLSELITTKEYCEMKESQGKLSFCEGCHINCYFDPTYTILKNKMTYHSLSAKLKYSWTKYIVYRNPRPSIKLF